MYAGLIAAGTRGHEGVDERAQEGASDATAEDFTTELVDVAHTTTLRHRKYTKEAWVREPVPSTGDD